MGAAGAVIEGRTMSWGWRRDGRGAAVLLTLTLTASAASAARVDSVRVADSRIVIRFDAPVATAASLVAPGSRQILVQVGDAVPGVGGRALVTAGGPVRQISQSRRDGGARIAFTLAAPTVIGDAGFAAGGRELTLQLQPASEAAFAAAGEAGWSSYIPFNFAGRSNYKVTQAVPPARRTRLPRVLGEAGKPLVVIDAGHGGVDPGAIGGAGDRKSVV